MRQHDGVGRWHAAAASGARVVEDTKSATINNTYEYNPCGKLKAERTRTWSSSAAHSTKATRTVREALLQQSLAGNK